VLGDIAGAAGKPHWKRSRAHAAAREIHAACGLLDRASPKGPRMLAVAVASDALMAKLDQNKADLAKLADPRTIQMNDAMADEIAARSADLLHHRDDSLDGSRPRSWSSRTGSRPTRARTSATSAST
jgi:hypothetical protein